MGLENDLYEKLCLGLLNRDSGRIEVLGQEAGRDVNGRSRFGFAAEGTGHLPHLSGLECVAYSGQLCGLPRRSALGRTIYLTWSDSMRRATGQQMRIVRGCFNEQRSLWPLLTIQLLLFLDEPTSGLDP